MKLAACTALVAAAVRAASFMPVTLHRGVGDEAGQGLRYFDLKSLRAEFGRGCGSVAGGRQPAGR
jgi:hypothetical protein